MTEVWAMAALWVGLALIATLFSIWFRIATALSEIIVGTVAQLIIGALIGSAALGTKEPWITFLSGTGAIVLTFLAGAELDPAVFKAKWKEASLIGTIAFFAPFLGLNSKCIQNRSDCEQQQNGNRVEPKPTRLPFKIVFHCCR